MVFHTWPGHCIPPGLYEESTRQLTDFSMPWGLYEWVCLPFGLMNAPAAFQRCMEDVLNGLRDEYCFPYFNDVLCFSKSFQDHVRDLKRVFWHLWEHGVNLRPKKCELFKRQVGVQVVPNDLEAVLQLKEEEPQNVGEVRALLDFLGYYKSFIQDFPEYLNHSLSFKRVLMGLMGNLPKLGLQGRAWKVVSCHPRHQSSGPLIVRLVDMLSSSPILAYPDFNLPFVLHTDAFNEGLTNWDLTREFCTDWQGNTNNWFSLTIWSLLC